MAIHTHARVLASCHACAVGRVWVPFLSVAAGLGEKDTSVGRGRESSVEPPESSSEGEGRIFQC
eukprot:scaffold244544_cov21-Tisochrysis_lutea.AAC.1